MNSATKQRELVPELRFSGFGGEWNSEKISTITSDVTYGLTVRPDYLTEGIPLISAREIKTGKIKYDEAPKISLIDYNKLSDKAKPRLGDLFLTKTGTIGFSSVVDKAVKAAITQNIAIIRIKDSQKIFNLFLLHQFKTSTFQKNILSKVNQSTIMDLQLGDIKKTDVTFPEYAEQHKIADFLGSVDAWLNNLRQQKTAFESYKRGMTQKLFSQEVRFKRDDGNDFSIWKKGCLLDYLERPATYGIVKAGDFVLSGVKMVRGGDIKNGRITQELVMVSDKKSLEYKRTITKVNDVLIALVGYPGESAVVTEDLAGANISRAVGLLRTGENIDPQYLVHFLNSSVGRREFLRPGAGSAQFVVNLKDLNQLRLPVLNKGEQIEIANFLNTLDQTITAKTEEITKVEEWKKGLMQKMFV